MKCFILAILMLTWSAANSQTVSPPTLAVLAVADESVSTGELATAKGQFEQALSHTKQFRVVTSDGVNGVSGTPDCAAQRCVIEIGRTLGVDRVVVFSVSATNQGRLLTARMFSVDPDGHIGNAMVRANSAAPLGTSSELDELARGIAAAEVARQAAVAKSRTGAGVAYYETRGRAEIILTHTFYGAVIGGLTGAALGYVGGDDDPDQFFSARDRATIMGFLGGIAGTGVGLISGLVKAYTAQYPPNPGSAAAVVDLHNRRFAFGAPRVSRRISPIDGTTMQTVDVLRVRF